MRQALDKDGDGHLQMSEFRALLRDGPDALVGVGGGGGGSVDGLDVSFIRKIAVKVQRILLVRAGRVGVRECVASWFVLKLFVVGVGGICERCL